MVHSFAATARRRNGTATLGKIGKQQIEDAGTLYPKRMETVDDEILDFALKFTDKAVAANKPFFLMAEPDPHARGHASF